MLLWIVVLITTIVGVWMLVKHKGERFDFWNDLENFISQWGQAFVCSAVANCNNCGEDGTMPCAGCNDNPSDCFNSTASDPGEPNWCKYFFSSSDPRSQQDCPDITSQLGPTAPYGFPSTSTDWFCTTDAVVRWAQGQGLQCLGAGDMKSCIVPYDSTDQGCCDTILANYAPGYLDNIIAAPAQNVQTFQNSYLKQWPTNALRIGTFIVYSDDQSNSLCFQTVGWFRSDGTPVTCALTPSNTNVITLIPQVSQPVYQGSFLDMAYAFFVGSWIVFINAMSGNDTAISNCLCFMKNTYTSKPTGNRNVCALLPFADTPSFDVIPNPMYDPNTNVDFLKITNLNNNKYPLLTIGTWVLLNDPTSSTQDRFLFMNTNTQTAFCIDYNSFNDQYVTSSMFPYAPSVASFLQTNLLQPNIPQLSCASSPLPPPPHHIG